MDEVTFGVATGDEDLRGVLDLQRRNVEANLEPDVARSEGFLTLRHDLELLREMQAAEPQVIARLDGRVVGYALVLVPELEDRFPLLRPMLTHLRAQEHRGQPILSARYFLMGQVCVDRPLRGSGVFAGLYRCMRELYSGRYDLVLTEAASRNTRSVRAHARVGFQLLERYPAPDGEQWDLILWDWRGEHP